MAVDRQMVARTVGELRAALPEADDLLAGLLRVTEATRRVLEVDGAGFTLVHASVALASRELESPSCARR